MTKPDENRSSLNGNAGLEPGPLLWERVALIGEGIVPRALFEGLSQADMQIFLTQPDPAKFPPHMRRLAELVSEHAGEEDGDWMDDDEGEDEEPYPGGYDDLMSF